MEVKLTFLLSFFKSYDCNITADVCLGRVYSEINFSQECFPFIYQMAAVVRPLVERLTADEQKTLESIVVCPFPDCEYMILTHKDTCIESWLLDHFSQMHIDYAEWPLFAQMCYNDEPEVILIFYIVVGLITCVIAIGKILMLP